MLPKSMTNLGNSGDQVMQIWELYFLVVCRTENSHNKKVLQPRRGWVLQTEYTTALQAKRWDINSSHHHLFVLITGSTYLQGRILPS